MHRQMATGMTREISIGCRTDLQISSKFDNIRNIERPEKCTYFSRGFSSARVHRFSGTVGNTKL